MAGDARFLQAFAGNRKPSKSGKSLKDFDLATRNRFFLALRSDDPAFDAQEARALLARQDPMRVCEIRP